MPEEIEVPLESIHEKLSELHHEAEGGNWTRYIALSTAVLAVLAAVGSLQAGKYINEAILEKNDQIAHTTKASDQWSYYQAKGIKALIVGKDNPSEAKRYKQEQEEIQKKAQELEKDAEHDGATAASYVTRHEHFALSVSLFQIAIALSAIAALMRQRTLWLVSLGAGVVGVALLFYGATR
ncbi:DUF4337 domain-containing protein [Armatimonas sp.]|uniref:DUF4337 domain-containing protein n=1 Tax=Armatimonas sp. TaxID=1872638 RepID=UPI00286CAD1F|nr:DUF4337 domain-containing protein [Armatimonas sp.]